MTKSHKLLPSADCGNLTISHRQIDQLKPDPKNARQHSKKQIRQIADSITTFGFNVPVLVDADSRVIAGHGRLLACRHLGWTEVPTISLDHLTEPQRRAFMIADNRLTEISVWDDRLLGEQLKELADLELNFDLEATGFEIAEIDLRIESLTEGANETIDPPIASTSGPLVTQPGDLWLLGRHRVFCGSALGAQSYAKLMGAEQAGAVFTDPPYNVAISGHATGLGRTHHREFAMASGEMDEAAFTAFLTTSLERVVEVCRPGSLIYACMDWRHIDELKAAAHACDLEMTNLCVWVKPQAGMGSLYRSQHELIFVYKLRGGRHLNNVQLGRFGRHRSNVWNYPAGARFGRTGEEGKLANLHPTIKPIAMVADAVLDCTRRGDIVLDPFLGSGTSIMACERIGRRCFGMEIDPLYVDLIVRRWQAYTGAEARLAAGGESFDVVAKAREPQNG